MRPSIDNHRFSLVRLPDTPAADPPVEKPPSFMLCGPDGETTLCLEEGEAHRLGSSMEGAEIHGPFAWIGLGTDLPADLVGFMAALTAALAAADIPVVAFGGARRDYLLVPSDLADEALGVLKDLPSQP
jgi:hypothetical protein